jgi:hypothetical protein
VLRVLFALPLVAAASIFDSQSVAAQTSTLVNYGPGVTPLHVKLRCDALQTIEESRAIQTDTFGFGNPTTPIGDHAGKLSSRTVYVVFDGDSAQLQLPVEFTPSADVKTPDSWYPLVNVKVTAGDVVAQFTARNPGPQSIRLNRISGSAQLLNYGPETLRANCHVQKTEAAF